MFSLYCSARHQCTCPAPGPWGQLSRDNVSPASRIRIVCASNARLCVAWVWLWFPWGPGRGRDERPRLPGQSSCPSLRASAELFACASEVVLVSSGMLQRASGVLLRFWCASRARSCMVSLCSAPDFSAGLKAPGPHPQTLSPREP